MKQTNLENALEVIGQGVYHLFEERDKNGECIKKEEAEAVKNVHKFLDAAVESYVLVQWPESQELMEEEWFDEEAIFCGGSEEKTGGSAYFVPLKRIF